MAEEAEIDDDETEVEADPATVDEDSTHEFTIELDDGSEIGEIAEFEFDYSEDSDALTRIDDMDPEDVTIEVGTDEEEYDENNIDSVDVTVDEDVTIELEDGEEIQIAADAIPSDPKAVESGEEIVVSSTIMTPVRLRTQTASRPKVSK
ncbi:hypothetical protein D8S78_24265 [Natrialba swarupiae]|nr:hypothetical protein [Natrialba swarupiae]